MISERLLHWYETDGRDLPWRRNADPYAVWIAEIMLQQTRVETVLPYYARFMDRFPDVEALAATGQEQVLRMWEGLGYYARARNLHRAARHIVRDHGGELPRDRAQLIALPGIGQYTASAIRAIAFGEDELALDGNLKRVLARLFDVHLDPKSSAGQRELTRLGASLLLPGRASEINQALMDLGASVCTARDPACERCPLRAECLARARGTERMLPVGGARASAPRRRAVAILWLESDRVLLRRQPENGLLGGMWGFPGGLTRHREGDVDCIRRHGREQLGVDVEPTDPLDSLEHSYSHYRVELRPYLCRPVNGGSSAVREAADLLWVPVSALDDYPMGKLDRTVSMLLQSR